MLAAQAAHAVWRGAPFLPLRGGHSQQRY